MEYKRIHITSYFYQYKKERIKILLTKSGDYYKLPDEYLSTSKRFNFQDNSFLSMEDRGDIEIDKYKCIDVHKMKNTFWVDMKDIEKYSFEKNDTYDVYYKIYLNFFEICHKNFGNPFDERCNYDNRFNRIKDSYENIFDSILQKRCKLKYIQMINAEINGYIHRDIHNGIYHPMDKNLLKKELEILEHFKMERIKLPFNSSYHFDYRYENINEEDFGGGYEHINYFRLIRI